MMICTLKFDKKKAVFWVIMAALVIVAIILLVGTQERSAAAGRRQSAATGSMRTEKARVAYLTENGWEVETPAISEEKIVIPRSFSTVFENYNTLQKQQGFDLSQYCGMEVTLYTYRVLNSGISDNVLAVLYVHNGSVIGGDVHSTALDGYICGIKQ